MISRRQPVFVWFAIFAMLVGALAPTLSRAMAPATGGDHRIEVCSAGGSRWIALSAGEAAQYPDHALERGDADSNRIDLDHCPYCSLQGCGAGLAAVDARVFLLAGGPGFAADLAFAAPRCSPDWPAARPRAPPSAG